ncbi:hypothetical protein DSL72_009306 [Monilinia vaccinii-corymbosi]|uniref:Major facilitator superfamily (MFS) profile domain-containing protein n=1 Tax=Monilinia vaccinii-corymbosi TaxID=61207 RepID=A0A8A3PP10_9HELO|nr:hypothetical protein DSL72_009306 [Monilinia vaccinii-corymbosi]
MKARLISKINPESLITHYDSSLYFVVLCLLSFMGAIDATIVTTSLPTITSDIGGERLYIWIANGFLFAPTIPQLLVGQISDIFGRRNPMLIAIALFALGSGIADGAHDPAMVIAGRTIQGLDSAGLYGPSERHEVPLSVERWGFFERHIEPRKKAEADFAFIIDTRPVSADQRVVSGEVAADEKVVEN